MKKIKEWLKGFTYYACQGIKYWTDCGYEFDCEAENAGEVLCEDCLCNGGLYNPDTGKKDFIRYFFMNYERWLRRMFPSLRQCRNCYHSCCALDVIPDWRCKIAGENKMIEPDGLCENYR